MKYLPNTITVLRILVTPLVVYLLLQDTFVSQIWALVVFVAAAISDYVDGRLARRLNVPSRLGKFLDPLADKVLVLSTFVALALLIPQAVPWWGVALIAARDLVVTVLRLIAESHGKSLRTLPMAKTKTTIQLTFLIGVIVFLAASKGPAVLETLGKWVMDSPIPFIAMIVVVVVTVGTGIVYLARAQYDMSTNATEAPRTELSQPSRSETSRPQ